MKLRMNSSASGPDGLLSFSIDGPLEAALEIELHPAQSVAVKPNARHARGSVNSAEPALDVAPCHERVEARHFAGAHEEAAIGCLRREKRRIRRLRDLVEPSRQHPAEQPLDHHCWR